MAVQNLFYYCNVIHDKLYEHGFVEATGNFQDDNFGLGGVGGDPVLCEAQDGSGTDNANFSTPSDGSSGRMQMFLWTQSSPKRDGALDSDFIWHEYGHGLTWRMIGGMSGAMSGAIGEGMGDVLAILMNQNDVVGEYSFNDPLGIRSEAYEGYSRTYGDFGGSSVHFDGEIYAAIHWDLRARYLANGFTVDDQLDDIVGGMNFTPSGPDFEAMRDGILAQAPDSRDCLIWESFAKFGVGVNATNDVTCSLFGCSGSITEDFSVPAECGVSDPCGDGARLLDGHSPFNFLPQYWRVDDGRTVSVLWDFTAKDPLQPVVEVPKAGDYEWYEGSWASLRGDARLSPEGVVLGAEAVEEQDPDVIGFLDITDTNPEEDQPKSVTLVYCWHRQDGGTAPPGPSVTIEPPTATVTGTQCQIVGDCQQVTMTMTFPAPCPTTVKASFSRAPGGPAVVVKSVAINGVCGSIQDTPEGQLSPEGLGVRLTPIIP